MLDPIQRLQQNHSIATHHDHADVDVLAALRDLLRFVHHQVHERIEATQNAGHRSSTVQSHCRFRW